MNESLYRVRWTVESEPGPGLFQGERVVYRIGHVAEDGSGRIVWGPPVFMSWTKDEALLSLQRATVQSFASAFDTEPTEVSLDEIRTHARHAPITPDSLTGILQRLAVIRAAIDTLFLGDECILSDVYAAESAIDACMGKILCEGLKQGRVTLT